MKIAKKIIWVILALLPMLPVLFTLIAHNGNQTAEASMPMGTISISTTGNNTAYIEIKSGTWAYMIMSAFDPYPASINATGLLATIANFMKFLNTNCGIPISAPLFLGFWYMTYLAILEICSLLLDLIMFIPRKCMQLMN